MKKLYYLIVIVLISSLVLTGCSLLSNISQVPATGQSGVSGIAKDSIDPNLICFDFEDLTVGQDVTFPGIIWDYLEIYSSNDELTLEVIKVNPNTSMAEKVAYNTITGTNNGCLSGSKGFGPVNPDGYIGPGGTHARPLDTNNIVFEFAQGVTVSTFSIDIFDYGDMVHKIGDDYSHFVVTLTAYDANDVLVDDYEYEITDGGQGITKYDACSASGLGIHYLNVTGFGISKVEMAFTESIDVGIGFDDICFTLEPVCTTELIAGQNEEVGEVTVKLSGGSLDVTYKVDEPWLMEEIHFHASFDEVSNWGVPVVNKAGNPAPGQFLKVFEDLGESNTYSFEIQLSEIGNDCGPLYFAAHAKVYWIDDSVDPIAIVLNSEAGSSMVYAYEEDTGNPGYPSSTVYKSGSAVEAFYPSWPSISGAKWISLGDWLEEVPDSDPDNHKEGWWGDYVNSWWKFERTIDIPLSAVNISGTLTITSDNVELIELNGGEVLHPDPNQRYPEVFGGYADTGQWGDVRSFLNLNLTPDDNNLKILVRNFPRLEGMPYDNPTGLIYKLEYQYELKIEETAWGKGVPFPNAKNWSMYFHCPDFVIPCE